MNLSTKEKCTIRDLIKIELRSLDKEDYESINIFHMNMQNFLYD